MFRAWVAQLSAVEGWRRARRYLVGTSRWFSPGCFQFLSERKPGPEPGVKVGKGVEVEAKRRKSRFEVVVWPRVWSWKSAGHLGGPLGLVTMNFNRGGTAELFSSHAGHPGACGNGPGVGLNQGCVGISPGREAVQGLACIQCKLAKCEEPGIIRAGVPRQGAGKDHFCAMSE